LSALARFFTAGTHEFRLAQVSPGAAGRTLEIDLFDPGDMGGTNSLSLEMPTANGYQLASVDWRDAGTTLSSSGTVHYGVTTIQTSYNGTPVFNGHWLVLTITIPADYTAPQNGWWKLQNTNTNGTGLDRITWRVNLRN
jgi:hypothetical protein